MRKILVIEIPSPSRSELVSHLLSEDFLVNTADDGPAGILAGRKHRPDVIVCSAELQVPGGPDLDGHQVLEAVRQDSELQLTPFILVTNDPERSHSRRAMELGADDCLVRPIVPSEISKTVEARIKRLTDTSELYVNTLRNTAEQLIRLSHYDSLS